MKVCSGKLTTAPCAHLGTSRRLVTSVGRQRSGRLIVRSSGDDLKAAIDSLRTKGRVPLEEVQKEVEVIKREGNGVFVKENWDGRFQNRATTDLRQIQVNGNTTTGRLSFNNWRPIDTEVTIKGSWLTKGDMNGIPNSYRVDTHFATCNGNIEGISAVVGDYTVHEKNPSRVGVSFSQAEFKPFPGCDEETLAKWLAIFKEANPGMDETGTVVVELTRATNLYLDILYLDQNIQITQGNFNTVVMEERIQES